MLVVKSSATDDPNVGIGSKWVCNFGTGSEGLVSTPGTKNRSRMQSVKDERGGGRN